MVDFGGSNKMIEYYFYHLTVCKQKIVLMLKLFEIEMFMYKNGFDIR